MRCLRLSLFAVIILVVLLTGCKQNSIPVLSQGESLGQGISIKGGYYVPLLAVAPLVGATASYDAERAAVQVVHHDKVQLFHETDSVNIIVQSSTPYVRLEALPALLGLEGRVESSSIRLSMLVPRINLNLTPEGLIFTGTSAINYSANLIDDYTYELVFPCTEFASDVPRSIDLNDSVIKTIEIEPRIGSLVVRFLGNMDDGWEPRVYFTQGRISATLMWPKYLLAPAELISGGRRTLEFAVPSLCPVSVLQPPQLTGVPLVRLRQRADILAGPDTYFPVAKSRIPAGTEGILLAYTPGWVRTRIQGQEGWLAEHNVTLELDGPDYPLSLRDKPTSSSAVIGVIPPNTTIILREKVAGGYYALGGGQEGYLLDEQLFLDSLLHLPRPGLSKVIRLQFAGCLPPQGYFDGLDFFDIVDAVSHRGTTLMTIAVPNSVSLKLDQRDGYISVVAGVGLKTLNLMGVPSGQQLSFETDGAHDLLVKRTATGFSVTIPFAELATGFSIPQPNGAIKNLEVTQLEKAVQIDLLLNEALAYRTFDSKSLTIMSSTIEGKRIVIDPGHGGRDPGAPGKLGWNEKDYTLDIALRLSQELRNLGAIPVLTHQGVDADRKVLMDERLPILNTGDTDLFLSIHLNAFTVSSYRGAETHYYKNEENLRLARLMQQSLVNVGMRNRGVVYAPTLAMLRRAEPPGVLLEVAFISNPDDEKWLNNESNRVLLIKELVKGVEAFFAGSK